MTREAMARLCALAALVRDARQSALARAEAEHQAVSRALDALDPAAGPDADPILSEARRLTYDRWAEPRRAALRADLALRAAACRTAKDAAAMAFGRSLALDRIAEGAVPRRGLSDCTRRD
jgi:hypothetical protein